MPNRWCKTSRRSRSTRVATENPTEVAAATTCTTPERAHDASVPRLRAATHVHGPCHPGIHGRRDAAHGVRDHRAVRGAYPESRDAAGPRRRGRGRSLPAPPRAGARTGCRVRAALLRLEVVRPRSFSTHTSPHPIRRTPAFGTRGGARGVGAQLVGDQSSRGTALGFQQRPKESDGCSPIPVRWHEDVQDVTVLVYCAPQILLATLDRDEHLVEMPGVSHPTAPPPQLPGVDRTEPLAPLPNRLVGDRHASLREEIFSIAEAEAESIVEPDRVADDVGWESISVIADRLTPHRPTLPLVAST